MEVTKLDQGKFSTFLQTQYVKHLASSQKMISWDLVGN